jgi:GH24 family phage-related lysozyme (muramidase)
LSVVLDNSVVFKPEDAVKYLREHEGVVSYMYLDVVGLVTIGVGFMLPSPDAAEALNLVCRDTRAPASAEQKRQDWESVHTQAKAKLAAAYKPFTKLDLPDSEIDSELAKRLNDFTKNLNNRFPEFTAFPATVQIGLLDMIYSLGPRGLYHGYPKLCAAAETLDWKTCAEQSSRGNVSGKRDADLKQLFLDAASCPS